MTAHAPSTHPQRCAAPVRTRGAAHFIVTVIAPPAGQLAGRAAPPPTVRKG